MLVYAVQSPFFDASNSDARNYGSIGSVLGHEMSHGFDDNGRQYDARGELHDWWSPQTVCVCVCVHTSTCHTTICGELHDWWSPQTVCVCARA